LELEINKTAFGRRTAEAKTRKFAFTPEKWERNCRFLVCWGWSVRSDCVL